MGWKDGIHSFGSSVKQYVKNQVEENNWEDRYQEWGEKPGKKSYGEKNVQQWERWCRS